MAVSEAPERSAGGWFYDPRVRSIVSQVLVIGGLSLFFWYIAHNTAVNLEKRGIASGFGFLHSRANYDITQGFMPIARTDTHLDVFFAGLLNTLVVAALGIVLCTVIGVILGVARLSPNWLLSRIVYCYVEVTRNVPLLLQLLLWYGVFITVLPRPNYFRDPETHGLLGDTIFLTNRAFYVPAPVETPALWLVVAVFAVGMITTLILRRRAFAHQEATGEFRPVLWKGLGLCVGAPLATFLLVAMIDGWPLSFDVPELKGFNFRGGMALDVSFMALLLGLTLYTASFVSETVRAGIQSVSHGQTEAAFALGLRPGRTMRMIILPQALRVIIPPLTSQYLNLTKNSSLAVAVSYPDLVATFGGTTLNQTSQAIECITITMAVYLTLSILISVGMNFYNKRIALVER